MTLELAQGFSAVQAKMNSAASKMRTNWPENYVFSLWLQQMIFWRRWEGGELGYIREDFWLFGDVLDPWLGKSKEVTKWKDFHCIHWCLIRYKCWSVFSSVDIHNISFPGGSTLTSKSHVHISAFTSMGTLIESFSCNQLPIFIKCIEI